MRVLILSTRRLRSNRLALKIKRTAVCSRIADFAGPAPRWRTAAGRQQQGAAPRRHPTTHHPPPTHPRYDEAQAPSAAIPLRPSPTPCTDVAVHAWGATTGPNAAAAAQPLGEHSSRRGRREPAASRGRHRCCICCGRPRCSRGGHERCAGRGAAVGAVAASPRLESREGPGHGQGVFLQRTDAGDELGSPRRGAAADARATPRLERRERPEHRYPPHPLGRLRLVRGSPGERCGNR